MEQMRESRSFPLVVSEHLIQKSRDFLGAFLQAKPMAYDLLASQGKAIDIILESISTGMHPMIALLIKSLQSRRTIGRCPRKPPRPLDCTTTKPKVS